jgi:hypothetical protein
LKSRDVKLKDPAFTTPVDAVKFTSRRPPVLLSTGGWVRVAACDTAVSAQITIARIISTYFQAPCGESEGKTHRSW